MNRRAFLTGLIAAPLVVRTAGLLMPVKVIEPVRLTAAEIEKLVRPPMGGSLWHISWGELSNEMFPGQFGKARPMFNLTPGAVNYVAGEFRPIGLTPGNRIEL